jgi:ubiquinol-cytochrome c reductase iron-sulfur subunit
VSAHDTTEPNRRDFLYVATGTAAVVGAAGVAWPFIDQMRPDASTLALATIEVDVSASGAASRSSSATARPGRSRKRAPRR